MQKSSQTARTGRRPDRATRFINRKLWLLAILAAALAALGFAVPQPSEPLSYHYRVDLTNAMWGEIDITLTVTGKTGDSFDLAFPAGTLANDPDGPVFSVIEVNQTDGYHNGARPVPYTADATSVRMNPTGPYPLELTYHIELPPEDARDTDLGHHLSVQSPDGFRIAGFSIFLVPPYDDARTVTVAFTGHDPDRLLVPWTTDAATRPATAAVGSTICRPNDLRDLYNSFVAYGNLRIEFMDMGDWSLKLATDTDWLFSDRDLSSLARRIARSEVEFFGSVPQPMITCLLTENRVSALSGFDTFGVHTGSSILLMMDPSSSYTDLKEHGANILAHEMFHGWLGEAIRQEDPEMMWFTEGATTLYAARFLARSGIWSAAEARASLDGRYQLGYFMNPARDGLTIAAAAADVLGDPETIRLAYAGGALACEQLDLWLASRTGDEHPLDDVLRELYATRDQAPLTRSGLVAAILNVTGQDCTDWLDRFVYGNQTLPSTEPMI